MKIRITYTLDYCEGYLDIDVASADEIRKQVEIAFSRLGIDVNDPDNNLSIDSAETILSGTIRYNG